MWRCLLPVSYAALVLNFCQRPIIHMNAYARIRSAYVTTHTFQHLGVTPSKQVTGEPSKQVRKGISMLAVSGLTVCYRPWHGALPAWGSPATWAVLLQTRDAHQRVVSYRTYPPNQSAFSAGPMLASRNSSVYQASFCHFLGKSCHTSVRESTLLEYTRIPRVAFPMVRLSSASTLHIDQSIEQNCVRKV